MCRTQSEALSHVRSHLIHLISNPVTPFSEGPAASKMIGNNFSSFEWPELASTSDVELTGSEAGLAGLVTPSGMTSFGLLCKMANQPRVSGQLGGLGDF